HELFEHQADAHPDRTALICADQRLTYGELEKRANQLAGFLRGRGIKRGDCVGLWLPRSLDAYVALVAVLKAGAVYVPLDPDFPAARVSFILSDCHARALLIRESLVQPAGVDARSPVDSGHRSADRNVRAPMPGVGDTAGLESCATGSQPLLFKED